MVAKNEDDNHGFVVALQKLGVPAIACKLPVDFMWLKDNQHIMGDRKTVSDMLKSIRDNRLDHQVYDMRGSLISFILLEGHLSDDGILVGEGPRAWDWNDFDNLRLSMDLYDGVKVVRSPNLERTPIRLKSFYLWTDKQEHGAWKQQKLVLPSIKAKKEEDREGLRLRRRRVAFLMAMGMGVEKAKFFLERHTLAEFLGLTQAVLDRQAEGWAKHKGVGDKTVTNWVEFLTRR